MSSQFLCKTRMHSSRMRTDRRLTVSGREGSAAAFRPPPCRTPGQNPTPADPSPKADPPVKRLTDRRKNITSPHTSYAVGKKLNRKTNSEVESLFQDQFTCIYNSPVSSLHRFALSKSLICQTDNKNPGDMVTGSVDMTTDCLLLL